MKQRCCQPSYQHSGCGCCDVIADQVTIAGDGTPASPLHSYQLIPLDNGDILVIAPDGQQFTIRNGNADTDLCATLRDLPAQTAGTTLAAFPYLAASADGTCVRAMPDLTGFVYGAGELLPLTFSSDTAYTIAPPPHQTTLTLDRERTVLIQVNVEYLVAPNNPNPDPANYTLVGTNLVVDGVVTPVGQFAYLTDYTRGDKVAFSLPWTLSAGAHTIGIAYNGAITGGTPPNVNLTQSSFSFTWLE
jgi:hypothetical protein